MQKIFALFRQNTRSYHVERLCLEIHFLQELFICGTLYWIV